MPSLKRRLLLAAGAVLAVFVISTGVALDRAFVAAVGQAEQDKLRGLVYALLGAVNITAKQVSLNVAQLGDPRLQQPGSGLYALIADARGRVMWRSPSLLEAPSSPAHMPVAGQWRYGRSTLGLAGWCRGLAARRAARRVAVGAEAAARGFRRAGAYRTWRGGASGGRASA
ncbi:MAG: hypothetical protein P8014_19395 [Acidihalobacter sp.]|uniref:hypothetical protein n=1 Tax=Acidihalobacter sp. TaxID=1872108 RepID=UPI00307FBF8C